VSGVHLPILLLGAAGVLLVAFAYLKGEPRVRGRAALLASRIAALLLVILLLMDVSLPGEAPLGSERAEGRWLLIDPDLSLTVPSGLGGTLWDEVLDRAAAEVAGGARLALATAGTGAPEGTDLAGLAGRAPEHPPGNLVEGALRLAEAGADEVLLLSTFRRPAALIETLARAAPVPLRLERVGGAVRNAGVAELDLPRAAEPGEGVEGRLTVFAEAGAPGDSLGLEVRVDGTLILVDRVALPPAGETVSVPLSLELPPGSDLVRVAARVVLDGDAFPPDDERVRWIRADGSEAGVVLVSLTPDWEPRVLLPLLTAVTGLEGEGYLSVGEDRFLRLEAGPGSGGTMGSEVFGERLAEARLLVLHGIGADAPDWLREVAEAHPRVIYLPSDPAGAVLGGVSVMGAAQGAPQGAPQGAAGGPGPPPLSGWIVSPEPPPSPLSPFLLGVSLAGLPPLSNLLPPTGATPSIVGLSVEDPAGGPGIPVVHLVETEEGRRVVVTAQGLWRWGSRDGGAREAYRALWGGAAAWLLAVQDRMAGSGIRPVDLVQPRGEPLRWEVGPEARGAELSLSPVTDPGLSAGGLEGLSVGPEVFRGSIVPGEDGVAVTPPVPPGIYRYQLRVPEENGTGWTELAPGWLEVERWAPSLRLPPLEVPDVLAATETGGVGSAEGASRPLRTHPVPYLALLLLLAIEWIGRRRLGLR